MTPFSFVHSDVWGPAPLVSLFSFRYFMTLVDEYLRTTWVYLLKSMHEFFSIIQLLHKLVKIQFDINTKTPIQVMMVNIWAWIM